MKVKIKPIKSTEIKDRRVWQKIVREVQRKPSPEALSRNEKALELLDEMRR
jgi:hypothetical protein